MQMNIQKTDAIIIKCNLFTWKIKSLYAKFIL